MATSTEQRPTADTPTEQKPATKAKPKTAEGKPTTTLTVPAKPAAVTAANLATLGGTAVAATGPVGWAVGAGAAGAVAAGVVVRRVVRRRRAARSAAGLGLGLGSGWPKLGPFRSLRSGRPGGGLGGSLGLGTGTGRRPSPRPRTGATGLGTGTPGSRRSGLGLPRLGLGGGSGTGAPASRKAAGAGAGTGSSAGPSRSVAARAARAARRAAGSATGAAMRGTGRVGKRLARAGWRNLAKPGWRWARRWVRRNVIGDKTEPKKDTPKTAERKTGAEVRRPDQQNPNQTGGSRPGAVRSDNSTSTREKEPVMAGTNNGKAPQPVGPVYQAARRLHATAVEYTVKGTMELRQEAFEFPYTIAELSAAIRARVTHCTKEAIDPAYAQALEQIATTVDAASQAAVRLGEAFDVLHRTEVRRVLQPRPNEQKWDISHNRP